MPVDMRLLAVAMTLVLLGALGIFQREEGDVDLESLLMNRADLQGAMPVAEIEGGEYKSSCLPPVIEGTGIFATALPLRPLFSQAVLRYESADAASRFFVGLQQRWTECVKVTWKMPAETLDGPALGDESASLFVSADCCGPMAERTVFNGHLYTLFVRHGRLIVLLSVFTRDTALYERVVTDMDAEIVRRLGR